MKQHDFVVVGSGGGGGTMAWMLAKAGFDVVLLEQGTDWSIPLAADKEAFATASHDEYRFRLERPEIKRRLRGDYNTFRGSPLDAAKPFNGGWTGSQLGGGSVLWGGWGFRGLPVDFALGTLFKATGQADRLARWRYRVEDWCVPYGEMEPFYDLAEALFSVCGDHEGTKAAIAGSGWFKAMAAAGHLPGDPDWARRRPFPQEAYPQVPSGEVVRCGMERAHMHPLPAPSSMVRPGGPAFSARDALGRVLEAWTGKRPAFWNVAAEALWSERVRDACNMCGFCGEFLCWGRTGPKSGTRTTFLRELDDLPNAEIVLDAKAFEVEYDPRLRRATGVRYLDLADPDAPRIRSVHARHVVVSCGAIQSARLLLNSGPPGGLGNRFDQVGRHAMFHLFGLGATCTLPPTFQGLMRGELGHTGNTNSFEHYFLQDGGEWWKAGIVVSAARKNPLEGAINAFNRGSTQGALLDAMAAYNRTVEIRLTGDDLPHADNRVDLDPDHVDEYGIPVARVTRRFGPHEELMFKLARPRLEEVFAPFQAFGAQVSSSPGRVDLFGDHQLGTCRMGDDPRTSVVDRNCRLHSCQNVFVVDSSVMPTSLGVNPMLSVVANALRVGTWAVANAGRGDGLG